MSSNTDHVARALDLVGQARDALSRVDKRRLRSSPATKDEVDAITRALSLVWGRLNALRWALPDIESVPQFDLDDVPPSLSGSAAPSTDDAVTRTAEWLVRGGAAHRAARQSAVLMYRYASAGVPYRVTIQADGSVTVEEAGETHG